jgi:hypothetical protein
MLRQGLLVSFLEQYPVEEFRGRLPRLTCSKAIKRTVSAIICASLFELSDVRCSKGFDFTDCTWEEIRCA